MGLHMGVFGLFSGTLYEPVSYLNDVPRTIDAPHFCRSDFPIWVILPSATILALARSGTRYRSVIETDWWLKSTFRFGHESRRQESGGSFWNGYSRFLRCSRIHVLRCPLKARFANTVWRAMLSPYSDATISAPLEDTIHTT